MERVWDDRGQYRLTHYYLNSRDVTRELEHLIENDFLDDIHVNGVDGEG
jgi:hypothetical protein